MCGLVGVCSSSSIPDRSWLVSARDTMSHRGPDDAGEWWSHDNKVGLAHRRLSIRDLSAYAHQPMNVPEFGLSIVFNGEIYNFLEIRKQLMLLNYGFKSCSDTEVLLMAYAEWGKDCVSKLNGMFSFAIYDERQGVIFIARDRAGEKPLYYKLDNKKLFFASELKALMANPNLSKDVDKESLDCYLSMGYVPGDRCILEGYNKLPPAHSMVFDLRTGETKVWRYWGLPDYEEGDSIINEDILLNELESLLESAVSKQLLADVPVGVLLSGGVDSSLITAMAARHSSQVQTFSIGFPGHGKMDETPHARMVAKYFGTKHTVLMAEPTSADLLPILARQFDEPMVDSSMFPTWLVSHLVRQHCTVALGGDGGDELFGGYGHYNRLLWLQRRLSYVPSFVCRNIADLAERILPVGFRGRNYLQGLSVDWERGLPLIASYFDRTTRRRLLRSYTEYQLVAESIREDRIPSQSNLLQRATRMDFQDYLAEDILVKVDRASMLNSLELRSPLLDHHLIEFAFGKVPSHLKATANNRKILLKRLAARILPKEFDLYRKQGFSIPMNKWLQLGPFRDLFWDTLLSADCIFDARAINLLLKEQDMGRSNGERLFSLVLFELWRREYNVRI